jgi:hypothetical protein
MDNLQLVQGVLRPEPSCGEIRVYNRDDQRTKNVKRTSRADEIDLSEGLKRNISKDSII